MSIIIICTLLYSYFFKYKYLRVKEICWQGKAYQLKIQIKEKVHENDISGIWIGNVFHKLKIVKIHQIQKNKIAEVETEPDSAINFVPNKYKKSKAVITYYVNNEIKFYAINNLHQKAA